MDCQQNPWTPWNDCTDYWFGINQSSWDDFWNAGQEGVPGYLLWLGNELYELGSGAWTTGQGWSEDISDWWNDLNISGWWNSPGSDWYTNNDSWNGNNLVPPNNQAIFDNNTIMVIFLGVLGIYLIKD